MKDNWTSLEKELEIQRNTKVERVWDEGDLDLGENPITQMTVINCLRRIGNNPITYDN